MRRAAPFALAVAALAAGSACSGGGGVVAPIGAPSPREADAVSLSPATWIYHPSRAPTPNAALALDDGTCVVAAADGERWLVSGAPRASASAATCKGEALGAAFGAPEPLRRIVRAGSLLRFIGESGTLYEAAKPIAPFTRTLTPPTRLGRVATQGDETVGISSAGDPYRLEQDGWVRGDGGGARLFDVEVGSDGRAIAVAWPEKVLLSRDGGRTFRPPKDAPKNIGALAVRAAPGAPLAAVGLRGQLAWPAGSDALQLEPATKAAARSDEAVAKIDVHAIGPKAQALAPARAVLTGSRWYEVRAAAELPDDAKKGDPKGWVLVRGELGRALTASPLDIVPDDREPRIGANGRWVVVGYMERGEDDGAPLRLVLHASSDEGRTFREMATLGAPDIRQVRIAVAPNGDALVAAACPATPPAKPGAKDAPEDEDARTGSVSRVVVRGKEDDGGCRPRAPVLVRARKGDAKAVVSVGVATDLRGLPVAPAFSADGAALYFLGRRAKGQEPSLFRSDDGGATWSSRPLVRRSNEDEEEDRRRYESEDGENWEDRPRSSRRIDLIAEEPLSVDADGSLGVVVDTPAGQALVSASADGEIRGVSQPPESSAVFAAYGRRALAVTIQGTTVTSWETTDGGATWEPAGVFRARFDDGEGAVACSAGGCVVGDAVTRLGWDAREDDARATPPPVQRPRPPTLRTPIACDLDAKPWVVLEGVEPTAPFPTVDEVARGKSAWSLMSVDPARAAVTVHAAVADASEPPRITSRVLFEPVAAGKATAVRALHQGEGYAAARPADGKKGVEVAWMNFFDGVLGKRAVEPRKADAAKVTPGALRMGLMSVTTGGIFIQPSEARDLAYLDTRGGAQWTLPPDWAALGVPGRTRTDATRIGGRTVHVGLLEAGPHVGLLAVDPPSTYEATTLAPPRSIGATSVVSWAYLGPSPGYLVVSSEAGGDGWTSGTFRAFGEGGTLGAPLAVPTAADLPDRPRPCRADEIKTTPRIESPLVEPGTSNVLVRGQRRLVEIPGAGDASSPDGTLRLLTSGAVLHGTPKEPCLAGWEATGFDGRRGGAVISGDLTRAWVFRLGATPGPRGVTGGVTVEVHGMTCRLDPAMPVPSGVWDELGVK